MGLRMMEILTACGFDPSMQGWVILSGGSLQPFPPDHRHMAVRWWLRCGWWWKLVRGGGQSRELIL
jgi:hypothetical protein